MCEGGERHKSNHVTARSQHVKIEHILLRIRKLPSLGKKCFWGRREEEKVEWGEGILFPVDGYLPMNSFMEAADLIKVNNDDNQQTRFDRLRVIDSYSIFHRENEACYLRCR